MIREGCVKFNNKRGFTLAELLIVLAVTTILLAITMVGLLHYANVLKLTEMDNSAKEMFISAQNHLTQADADGTLSEFVKNNSSDATKIGNKMTSMPSDMSSEEWDKNKDNYYYISYAKGDTSALSDSILKLILPFGSIDEKLRKDGNYIIEYNVKTATIYGVFFDDRYNLKNAAAGTDDEIAGNVNNGIRSDDDTGKSARMHYTGTGSSGDYFVIGYYGGAMVDILGTKITQPEISVSNGDKLQVTVTDPNYYNSVGGVQLKTYVTLKVTGMESGNSRTFELKLSDSSADPVKADASQKYWSVSGGNNGAVYKIDLDDITVSGGHFAELCSNMIPGEDITVTATCSSNEVLTQVARSKSVMTNSIFGAVKPDMNADGKTPSGTSTAEVTCIRHLENLDPTVSNLPQASGTSPSTVGNNEQKNNNASYVNAASVTSDIDYDKFVSKVGSSFSIYKYKETDTAATTALAENSYYGIRNDALTTLNGNNKTIKNVVIKNTTEGTSGDGVNGALLRFVNTSLSQTYTYENMILQDFSVYAYKNASAMVAECNAGTSGTYKSTVNISNILIRGGKVSGTGANGNSAPLFGYFKGTRLTVKNCGATMRAVSDNGDAGGLIGEIGGTTAAISKCYAGGFTANGKYSAADSEFNVISNASSIKISGNDCPSAGGFIGKIGSGGNVTFDTCYSTCSARGPYSGGFTGYVYNTGRTIKNCYTTGLVKGTTAGTFIGKSESSITLTDDYYLNGITEDTSIYSVNSPSSLRASVTGVDAAGAIAETGTNRETKPNDTTLSGTSYPFKMVATVGASEGSRAHYGDWPKTAKNNVAEGSFTFAYREGTAGSYKWYGKSYSLDADNNVKVSTFRNLESRTGQYIPVSEPCYGMLLTADEKANVKSNFKSISAAGYYFDLNNPETVSIDGQTLYFYKFKSSLTGIQSTPTWYLGDGKGNKAAAISVYFNMYFAVAMDLDSDNLGTSEVPYEIRTQAQMNHIDDIAVYRSYTYVQSCDIKLTGTYYAPVVKGDFAGSYDATITGKTGYSITGLNENITNSLYDNVGLFESNSGTLTAVNLKNSDIRASYCANNVGTIAGSNTGKMENCNTASDVSLTVDVSNMFTNEYLYDDSGGYYTESVAMNVGGMVGNLSGNSDMINCVAEGKLICYGRSGGGAVMVGGLVGLASNYHDTEPDLSKCVSKTSITTYYSSKDYNMYIGGLTGYSLGTNYNDCSTYSVISSSSYKAVIGGFVGKAATYYNWRYGYDMIPLFKTSFSRTSITDNNNTAVIGGFVGDTNNKGEHVPEFHNCYASTDFAAANTDARLFVNQNHGGQKYYYCHGVERDGGNMVLSKRFIDGNYDMNSTYDRKCYAFSNPSFGPGEYVKYITSAADYMNLTKFTDWDTAVWEVKNGSQYPTLINNPEQ